MTTHSQPDLVPQIVRAGEGHHISTPDATLLFKRSERDLSGGCSLALGVTQPGGGPPPHRHHHDAELFIMVEGELQVGGVQGWQTARAGDLVWLPAGSVHTFRNTGTRPATHWLLLTTPDFQTFYATFAGILNAAPDVRPDVGLLQAAAAEVGIEFLPADALPPLDVPR